jgi:hypothetical protein
LAYFKSNKIFNVLKPISILVYLWPKYGNQRIFI